MTNEQVLSKSRVLHSWKEIASYTGRGVRTIQRYEAQYGFPVRRPSGSPRSAVLAFAHEVDEWLAKSPTREQPAPKRPIGSLPERTGPIQLLHIKAHLGHERAEVMYKRLEQMQMLVCKLKTQLEQHPELRTPTQRATAGG